MQDLPQRWPVRMGCGFPCVLGHLDKPVIWAAHVPHGVERSVLGSWALTSENPVPHRSRLFWSSLPADSDIQVGSCGHLAPDQPYTKAGCALPGPRLSLLLWTGAGGE